jgi:hypothetical protein
MFVTPDFVDAEISHPKPGLKARLIAGIHDGQGLLLSLSEIRRQNTHTGLDMVLFDGAVRGCSAKQRPKPMRVWPPVSSIFIPVCGSGE